MKTTDLLAILFLFGVLLGACTKEGPIGPAGEDGQDGIDGIDGIDGQDGQDGIDGNANVIYSNWFYLTEAARDTTIDGSLMKIKDITVPELTQSVIDTAAILVYMRWSVNVFQLPYISYAGGIGNSVDFIVKPSRLFITRFAFDNSGSIGFSSSLEYRYIIIPGGVLSIGTKSVNENGIAFENLTYAELCDLLKIPL